MPERAPLWMTEEEVQSMINAQEYAFAVLSAEGKDQDAIDCADQVLVFLEEMRDLIKEEKNV